MSWVSITKTTGICPLNALTGDSGAEGEGAMREEEEEGSAEVTSEDKASTYRGVEDTRY